MAGIPNIQQLLDDHVFESLQADWGNQADGDNWIDDQVNNTKNKYAVKREYRNLQPEELEQQVKGQLNTHKGVMIINNVRLVHTPVSLNGKIYGVRYEMILYAACKATRQSQIGGDRAAYELVRDFMQTLMDNPFSINRVTVPFVLQAAESEFANTEIDVQRLIAIIPTSELRPQ